MGLWQTESAEMAGGGLRSLHRSLTRQTRKAVELRERADRAAAGADWQAMLNRLDDQGFRSGHRVQQGLTTGQPTSNGRRKGAASAVGGCSAQTPPRELE